MRIVIDGIAVSHPQAGGYHTYTTRLVEQLARVDSHNDYTLLLHRPMALSLPANWTVRVVPTRLPVVGVAVREQIALPRAIRSSHADLWHAPCATGPLLARGQGVVTIYDTIEFTSPLPPITDTRIWAMRLYSRWVQAAMARKASHIITISGYAKGKIVERFRTPEQKVHAIHLGVGSSFFPRSRAEAEQQIRGLLDANDFVLALASLSRRKNIGHLLAEYAMLDAGLRRKHPLVLVFPHPALRDTLARRASELGVADDVIFLERVSDEQLAALYTLAAVFAFPSLEEGFGLPPLEAMACGTPVVASNTSAMPEVLQDAARLASPTERGAFAGGLAQVLTDAAFASELAQRGLARSQQFSWTETARQTLAVYEGAIA